MNKSLSMQLDGIRGLAAIYIICHHYFLDLFMNVEPWNLSHFRYVLCFGQEVVILFLMLSGFLSYNSWSKHKEISIKDYLIRKIKRIYPLYLVAILLSVIASCIIGQTSTINLETLIGNLLFLQDSEVRPGTWFRAIGSNGPLWYMSYQWWSYVLFILLVKFVKPTKYHIASFCACFLAMLSFVIYPNHFSAIVWYFWIFFMGMCLSIFQIRRNVNKTFVLLVTMLFIGSWLLFHHFPNEAAFGEHPNIELRHFLVALTLYLLYFIIKSLGVRRFRFIQLFRFVAPFSLGIYLFQIPVLNLFCFLGGYSMLTAVLALVACCSLAYLIEVRLMNSLIFRK